jgi:hypothetical protein
LFCVKIVDKVDKWLNSLSQARELAGVYASQGIINPYSQSPAKKI